MEVKEVKGTKVTAQRGDFKRIRNIEKFKILKHRQPSTHQKGARTKHGEETDEEEDDWLKGFKGKRRVEEQEVGPGEHVEDQEPPEEAAGAEAGLQEQARPESETSSPPLHLRGSEDQAHQGGPQHQVMTEFGLIEANSTFLMITPAVPVPAEIPVEHQLVEQGLPVEREQEDQEDEQARYQMDRPKRKRTVNRKYPEGEVPQHISKKYREEEEETEQERDADTEKELEAEAQNKEERDSPENSWEGSRSDLGLLLEQPRAATTPTSTPTLTPQAGAAAQASSVGPRLQVMEGKC